MKDYTNAAPIPATPEQQRKREALVVWLVTGIEPEDAKAHIDGFDMTDWRVTKPCGTVCCMAGAACEWWSQNIFSHSEKASNFFGFEDVAASALYLWYPPDPYQDTTDRDHAARVFQNFCDTGIVDWEGME